jgi:hypothetical protein
VISDKGQLLIPTCLHLSSQYLGWLNQIVGSVSFFANMDDEIRELQNERKASSLSDKGNLKSKNTEFDTEIYGDGNEEGRYLQSLPLEDEENGDDDEEYSHPSTKTRSLTARDILDENMNSNGDSSINDYRAQNGSGLVDTRISIRESEVRIVSCYTMFPVNYF